MTQDASLDHQSPDQHSFGDESLSATVTAQGAELTRLDTTVPSPRPLLWDAGPEWPRHSPVLFPIVGRLINDESYLGDLPVRMKQHGFARDSRFTWIDRTATGCTLELTDSPATRTHLPQAFRLRLHYQIAEGRLTLRYTVHNPHHHDILHASLGAHPAFTWPQTPGAPREGHRLVFEQAEPAPIFHVADGLLQPDTLPSPIVGTELTLRDALFENDALILKPVMSRSLQFLGPEGSGLEMGWDDFPELGIWTKPGAGFLCIEPWHGYATPEGFNGGFSKKPGSFHLEPGESWEAAWWVRPI